MAWNAMNVVIVSWLLWRARRPGRSAGTLGQPAAALGG
jgi:hypothetical protein